MKLGARDYVIKDPDFLEAIPRVVERIKQEIIQERTLIETKESLKDLEALQIAAFDSIDEAIHLVDLNLNIQLVNDMFLEWCATFGFEQDLIGENLLDVFSWISKEVLAEYDQVIHSGEPLRTEETTQFGSRTVYTETRKIPVKVNGKVTGVLTVLLDVTDRKLAEMQIRKSEERYRSVVQDNPVMICSYLPDGVITFVNQAYTEYYQKPAKDIIGKTILDVIPEYDRERVLSYINGLTVDHPVQTHEHEVVIKNGEVRWNRWVNRALFDGQGKVILYHSIGEDITDQKKMETALLESESKMQSIFRVAPTGIGMVVNRVITEVNLKFCEITGYSKEDLIGKSARLVYPSQEEFEKVGRVKYDEISKFGTGVVETVFLRKDGILRNILLASTPIDVNDLSAGVIFTALDITDLKETESSLMASEKKFRKMFENNPNIMILANLDTRTILDINSAYTRKLGYSKEEVLNLPGNLGFSIADQVKKKKLFDSLSSSSKLDGIELDFITMKGNLINGLAFSESILVGDEILHIVTIVDVSERKQAELLLQDRERKLIEAQNIAQLGDFNFDLKTGFWKSSQALDKIFGIDETYSRDIQGWLDLVHPEHQNLMNFYLNEHVFSQGNDFSIEFKVISNKSLQEKWVLGLGEWVFDNDQQPVEMFGTIQDITDRKNNEEIFRETQDQLQFLHEIDSTILEDLDPQDIAKSIIGRLRKYMGSQWAMIKVMNKEKNSFQILASDSNKDFMSIRSVDTLLEFYADAEETLARGDVFRVKNYQGGEDLAIQAYEVGISETIIVPLFIHDSVIGTIELSYQAPGQFVQAREDLVRQVANQLAIAIQKAQLLKKIQDSRNRAQILAQKVVSAQEDERRTISRELHDESGQVLTALKIQLDLIRADLPPELEDVRSQLADVSNLAGSTMDSLRSLAHGLRPPVLDTIGLEITLHELCRDFSNRVGLKIVFKADKIPKLPEVIQISLYRFLQEALTNVVKHSQANKVNVNFLVEETEVVLGVEDDGVGFDMKRIFREEKISTGMGLTSMTERIELIGGKLMIESQDGCGTYLTAKVPMGVDFLERREDRI
nr:PAS domain S-box protein [Anaerolineaceae bacterium]